MKLPRMILGLASDEENQNNVKNIKIFMLCFKMQFEC